MEPSGAEQRRQSLTVLSNTNKVEQLKREATAPQAIGGFKPHARREQAGSNKSVSLRQTEERIVAVLRTIFDPEIPVNIYDLGLIYDIDLEEGGTVRINMTLTAPGCPVAGILVKEVETKVRGMAGVTRVSVDLVWEPPWSKQMMSEAALLELGLF